jgi:glyoxylase-like metal-dependent hydrolase (beta-lactamase superfamily II)
VEIKLYAMTCGHLTGDLGYLLEGGEGRISLPIPAYLIEHPKGIALFDSGMHPDCQTNPAARLGPRLSALFDFDYHPGEEISARLAAIGRDPARIDILITSHFHFDHVGGTL